jgi:hypothetical protein
MPRGIKRPDTPGTKQCAKCEAWKPLSDYPKHKNTRDRHQPSCRACISKYHHDLYRTPRGNWTVFKSTCRRRNIDVILTYEDFLSLWQKPCTYCGDDVQTIGLDRVDSSGPYSIDNVVPCCSTCNTAKNTMTVETFTAWVNRVHHHLQTKSDEGEPGLPNPPPC